MPRRGLVGLGQAYGLRFRPLKGDDLGRERVVSFAKTWWWAWDGAADTGRILLVKTLDVAQPARPLAPFIALHRTFHGEEPTSFIRVDGWAPAKPITIIGRAVSLTYDARSFSGTKGDVPYQHYFGAFTHADRPPFDSEYWPDVAIDAGGNLALLRRPGNTFRLADWLEG
jgi:hypothetical protein